MSGKRERPLHFNNDDEDEDKIETKRTEDN